MFLSTYTLKLDEKGRFFLPTKWRSDLAEGLVIVQGFEQCLSVYTPEEFAKVSSERIKAETGTLQEVRAYQRMMGADASQTKPDKQGRVGVPAVLRDYAHLYKDIVVTGAIDHAEIWNPEAWEQYRNAELPKFANMDKLIGQTPGGDR